MAGLLGIDMRTVRRAVAMLKEHRWIETRQIGDGGTVNAYIINDRVVWSGPREGIRYNLFTANVVVSDAEQPDSDTLDHQEPLRKLPSLYPGEQQLPSGNGLPPESQPSFNGMELSGGTAGAGQVAPDCRTSLHPSPGPSAKPAKGYSGFLVPFVWNEGGS